MAAAAVVVDRSDLRYPHKADTKTFLMIIDGLCFVICYFFVVYIVLVGELRILLLLQITFH